MKWYKNVIGVEEVSPHLVRVFNRGDCRGIIISVNGFSQSAVNCVKYL
ncbi:MAG: restriction endonuclease [Firmicutes bacterium]|nr:restriction endonuclease [Bacillota bacterium]